MGKRTEFNLRTVPRLFEVMDEKVTRADLLVVDILKTALKTEAPEEYSKTRQMTSANEQQFAPLDFKVCHSDRH